MKKILLGLGIMVALLNVCGCGMVQRAEEPKVGKVGSVVVTVGETADLPEGNWATKIENSDVFFFDSEKNQVRIYKLGDYSFYNPENDSEGLIVSCVSSIVSELQYSDYPSDTTPEVSKVLENISDTQEVLVNEVIQLPEGNWIVPGNESIITYGNNVVTFTGVGNYMFVDNMEAPNKVLEIRCHANEVSPDEVLE